MRPGEADPALRRVFFQIFLDDGVTPATNADTGAPAGTIRVSANGAGFVNGAGTFARFTGNLYFYQLTPTEELNGEIGFVGLKFERSGYKKELVTEIIGQVLALGETAAGRLRYPMIIFGTASEPSAPTEGATVTTASDLQNSYNGDAFFDSPGSLVEVGSGLYFYQGVAADADTRRKLIVKYESTGFQLCAVAIDVAEPGEGAVSVTPSGPAAIPVLPSTDSPFAPLDHVTRALDRLPHQYRGDGIAYSETQAVLRMVVEPIVEVETAAIAVLSHMTIDKATGFMLTMLGELVGRPREGVSDDEIYRRYVRAQIAANKSDGTNRDILSVARLVLGTAEGYTINLKNDGVAAFRLEVSGAALPTSVAQVLMKLLLKAVGAGIRIILEYSTQPPANVLRWSTQGVWGTAVWARATDRLIP